MALPGAGRPDPSLPGPQEWAAMLTVAILQVVAGRRPLEQLERWLDDPAITSVRRAAAVRRRARSAPVSPADVVSVRVQCVSPRVVEVAARVRERDRDSPNGPRSAAVALRLEGTGARWRCTAVELGLGMPVIDAA